MTAPATSNRHGGPHGHRHHRIRPDTYLFFLAAFGMIVLLIHVPLLDLPLHWDELGQFVPASLDLLNRGLWVPASATPNVHPPGLMAYLALVWRLTGFSIIVTRLAMLALAAVAVWLTFLLAIELCRGVGGAPAFTAVILLMVSPVFYMQSMMAQLDMPAMLFTVWALLLFVQNRIRTAAIASTALVLVKETGIVVPLVFAVWLLFEGRRRDSAWFLLPFAALAGWLAVLYRSTGHIFGNAAFTDYNVFFPLHPVRLAFSLARRMFYLVFDNFHWIGWIAVIVAWRRAKLYRSRAWRIAAVFAAAQILAVSVLGGAILERYLLPVLPLVYIAFAAAWSSIQSSWSRIGQAAAFAGLIFSIYWNPPYPTPFENNLAMVDFVRLHEAAASYVERAFPDRTVTTAWPLSIELRRPYCGYVQNPMKVAEVPGFRPADLARLQPGSLEVFVLFSREWERNRFRRLPYVQPFMHRFYRYDPQVLPQDLERRFGLKQVARWSDRGQWIAVFVPGRPLSAGLK